MLSGILIPPLGIAVSPFSAVPFFLQLSGKMVEFLKKQDKVCQKSSV